MLTKLNGAVQFYGNTVKTRRDLSQTIFLQMFKVEDVVVVTGLKKDKDLNGAMGIVVGHGLDKVDKSITRHKVLCNL